MRHIIAIGGGEIGRPGTRVETLAIDKEIVKASGKKRPLLLFLPTASGDAESYCAVVERHFGKRLGCRVEHLLLIKERLRRKEIERRILAADIIYVGGGNTLRMISIWRRHGVDRMLFRAYRRGVVMSGVSAGALCWFAYGNSDSRKYDGRLTRAKTLGWFSALLCPHFDGKTNDRKTSLSLMMRRTPGVGIALDNRCALEIKDEEYRILSSKRGAGAHKAFWKGGTYHLVRIAGREYRPLKELFLRE